MKIKAIWRKDKRKTQLAGWRPALTGTLLSTWHPPGHGEPGVYSPPPQCSAFSSKCGLSAREEGSKHQGSKYGSQQAKDEERREKPESDNHRGKKKTPDEDILFHIHKISKWCYAVTGYIASGAFLSRGVDCFHIWPHSQFAKMVQKAPIFHIFLYWQVPRNFIPAEN